MKPTIYDSDYLQGIPHKTSDSVSVVPGGGGIPSTTSAEWLWDASSQVWYKTVKPNAIRTANLELKFDGDLNAGNFVDSSPNGYTGTPNGGAIQYDGIMGNAVRLNGETSYVDWSASINFTGAFTISTWFWYHPNGSDQSLCNKYFTDSITFLSQFDIKINSLDKVVFAVFDDFDNYLKKSSVGSVRNHDWNHILCKYNPTGNVMTIKINDVEQTLVDSSKGTFIAIPSEATIPFRMGMRDGAY